MARTSLCWGGSALTATAVRLLAQPYVRYRDSPLSVDLPPRATRWPRAGDRLPDRTVVVDGRRRRLHDLTAAPGIHVLLESDADPAAISPDIGLGSHVRVHRLPDAPGAGIVAVRPDGHVGFRCGGGGSDQLRDWFALVAAVPTKAAPRAPRLGANS